jgi:DNA-directed RNA polymerase specialized sigma24 family protein
MLSDEDLIAEVRRGSRAAFETLFERYRQPVWQFFRRRTPRADVFGVAYNILLAHQRKAPYRATEPLDVEPPDRAPFSPDHDIWIRAALATLDEAGREIVMLREYEHLSYQEIADLRGTPLNTVRSQLFRAREALRSALETRTPHAVRTTHGGR